MRTVALLIPMILSFGVGFVLSWAIWTQRIKKQAFVKKLIENARLQGRLDRGDNTPPGLEPPKPWKTTEY